MRVVDAGTWRSGVLGCGGAEYGERESVAIEAGDAAFSVVGGPAGNGAVRIGLVSCRKREISASARELWFMALRTTSSSESNGGAESLDAIVFVFMWKYADLYVE